MDKLILVTENDIPLGTAGKMEVHEKALLHRAFSVFIFNNKGDMLLQQRAAGKYHSAGLWTNACCSHPYEGQETIVAAEKRLYEEMGFTTALTPAFEFMYKAVFDNGLTEHEYDHVFIGNYNGDIFPNTEEVQDFCFKDIAAIKKDMQLKPQLYTEWFKIALPRVENYLNQRA